MSLATLNGFAVLRASVVLPRWGIWWADVQIASGEAIPTDARACTLELGGLSLVGTVSEGGAHRERGWYRLVGGAAGWRRVIDRKAYRNEAGVKLSTVLQDAAREAGELLGAVDTSTRVGPAYVRPKAEASRVLDLLAEEAWHVDETGTTQLGVRATTTYVDPYTLIRPHPSQRLITVAAEDVSRLLPGAEIEGLEASTVRHELTPKGIRSHVWGLLDRDQDDGDGLLGPMKTIVLALMAHTDFHRRLEYRVDAVGDGYLDLRPVRATLGMPDLANVPMRTGIPGGGGEPQIGSTALVGFIDGDPCRPYVCDYEGEAGDGWLPTTAKLDASTQVQIGEQSTVVKLSTGEQFVALENLVKAQLDLIASALNGHTHTVTAGVAGATPGLYTAGQVKATKVKAT